MNISQHAIIPLGYPVKVGYYGSNGSYHLTSSYRCLDLSNLIGCNSAFNCVVLPNNLGNLRIFNVSSGELINGFTVDVSSSSVFSLPIRTMLSFNTHNSSGYLNYIKYPFLIFFKVNTLAVTSFSLDNSLTSDIIDKEILL